MDRENSNTKLLRNKKKKRIFHGDRTEQLAFIEKEKKKILNVFKLQYRTG